MQWCWMIEDKPRQGKRRGQAAKPLRAQHVAKAFSVTTLQLELRPSLAVIGIRADDNSRKCRRQLQVLDVAPA
jgi:hypothetical protein